MNIGKLQKNTIHQSHGLKFKKRILKYYVPFIAAPIILFIWWILIQ